MSQYNITIEPFGESALILTWPNEVSENILQDIISFQNYLKTKLSSSWEYVPVYNSLTLINQFENFEFDELKSELLNWYQSGIQTKKVTNYLWKFPVCYEEEFGLDFKRLEEQIGLNKEDIIHAHTSHEYTVYGIGFLPGFMYLGGVPKILETARLENPRLKVASGSVGLAGKQTGIYPAESPGGWNIIGRCPVPMFNLKLKEPCVVNVGDKVAFFSISKAEYDVHIIEAEVGILKPEKVSLDA